MSRLLVACSSYKGRHLVQCSTISLALGIPVADVVPCAIDQPELPHVIMNGISNIYARLDRATCFVSPCFEHIHLVRFTTI